MAKVRAVIEADSGTLLVDFPQGIYALYEKLRSVGIRHSPSNIPIADEEDGAIRVKLYAEDDVGKRLTLLFSEDNTRIWRKRRIRRPASIGGWNLSLPACSRFGENMGST